MAKRRIDSGEAAMEGGGWKGGWMEGWRGDGLVAGGEGWKSRKHRG